MHHILPLLIAPCCRGGVGEPSPAHKASPRQARPPKPSASCPPPDLAQAAKEDS